MQIKPYLSRLLALVLVVVVGLMGCTNSVTGLTGNYAQDTLLVVDSLTKVVDVSGDASVVADSVSLARKQINDYISRYRRDASKGGLRSFTTMQTALNSLAGYYSSYGNRPLPDKLKTRLKDEFKQAAIAVQRGV